MYNIPSPAFPWEFPPQGERLTLFSTVTLGPCPHYRLIYSRPHYHFYAFWTVHTKTLESDKIARCYAHATNTRACDIFGHRFRCVFDSPHRLIRYVFVFVPTHFQELFQIDAFSMKTLSVLVWTVGLKALKCMRYAFSKENALVWMGLYVYFSRLT